jgi:hypothetical protein
LGYVLKRLLIIAISALLLVSSTTFAKKSVFFPGEELVYKVSYMGIKLGEIKIISDKKIEFEGEQVYKVFAEMKSAEGIPFVKLFAKFESWMDETITHSHLFHSRIQDKDGDWIFETFDMDYPAKKLHWVKREKGEVVDEMSTNINKWVNDGTSLFFFARQFTDLKKTIKVPTVVNNTIGITHLNFHCRPETVEVDDISYPVKTLYFDGRAEWEGIYGLKGYFKGWFSDDEARVPIKAQMNVYVGNVDIELVSWKRGDWQPPKGKVK